MTGTAIQTNGPDQPTTSHLNLTVTLADAWRREFNANLPKKPCPMNMLAPPSWKFLRAYVAAKHRMSPGLVTSRSRRHRVAAARQELAFLMRTHTNWRIWQIARRLGRHPSTIQEALIKRVRSLEAAQ